MKFKSLVVVVLLITFESGMYAQVSSDKECKSIERMSWWTQARFGMFIHWGLYALPARHEWVMSKEQMSVEKYQQYKDYFNPDLYNPVEWARLAKKAGMKYVVFTSKHHDGFCMFDSQFTDYKITNTNFKRDVMAELIEAFKNEGIRIGIYYSLIDWHHPDFLVNDPVHPQRNNKQELQKDAKRDVKRFQTYLKNQLTEILTNYGKIDLLFMDFSYPNRENGKGKDYWNSPDLYQTIRKLQPDIIINDRLDLMEEKGWDYLTPEQFMPREWVTYGGEKQPWETCQTFSGSWGYFRDEYTWKSARQTIVMLTETVSKGGNLLLNVGPTARGVIQQEAVDRLEVVGEWMRFHGRAVYGCTAAPGRFIKPDNCMYTFNPKTNRLYVHVLEWPFKSLYLPGLGGKVKFAQLLNDASELKINAVKGAWLDNLNEQDDGLTIQLPVSPPDVQVPVIELFLN